MHDYPHPFYGSRKLTALVREEFGAINRKRVQRYMQEMGLAAIGPQPHTSRRTPDHAVYLYLLRSVTAQAPMTCPNAEYHSNGENHLIRCSTDLLGPTYLVPQLPFICASKLPWRLVA